MRFWKARFSSTGRRGFQEGYLLHSAGPRRLHHPTPLPVTGLGAAWERPRSGLGLREDKGRLGRELWWRHTLPLGQAASRRTLWGESARAAISSQALKNLRPQSFGSPNQRIGSIGKTPSKRRFSGQRRCGFQPGFTGVRKTVLFGTPASPAAIRSAFLIEAD